MKEQTILQAQALVRKMYTALTEVMDLTGELSEAVQRQDQVSVQMFLQMRQEPISQLEECRSQLRLQCTRLPAQEGQQLRRLLSEAEGAQTPAEQTLTRLVRQNQKLLQRILAADQVLSRRVGGRDSFYETYRGEDQKTPAG